MARYGQNNNGASIGDMTVGDYANGMPNIRLGEMFRSFGRQLRWVIPLFALGAIPAWYLTKDLKRSYEGVGTIMVKQGKEHTFDDAGSSILQGPEAITELESAIMKNSEVIDKVVGDMVIKFGPTRFNEQAFKKIEDAEQSMDPVALADAQLSLHKSIESAFWVTPRAKAGVIDVGFKHEDGEVAVATLNAFIHEYMAYRRTIFVDGSADVFRKEATSTKEQLDKIEREIQSFLAKNGISNFGTEQDGAAERTEALRAEMNGTRTQIAETEAALAAVEAQLRGTPEQINIQINDSASQRVAQAELELSQLEAKYLPTSDPVRAKRAEVNELKSYQASNNGKPVGGIRVGPNPTHQNLETRFNELRATADSLREKEFTVQQLLTSADSQVRKLRTLGPEYSNLLRERSTLDESLRNVTSKLQEAEVAQQQAAATTTENVKIISEASFPRKGRDMKKIMFALAMLGWGFTLFMIALLKVFLDPRLYTDPTRRMRPARPNINENASDDWGSVPYRDPAQPYVPEPVPMQPAAAQYSTPYAQPAPGHQQGYQQPYQPQPTLQPAPQAYPVQPGYPAQAAPYATGAAAVDYDSYVNPYSEPQVQPHPVGPGQLPMSETDR